MATRRFSLQFRKEQLKELLHPSRSQSAMRLFQFKIFSLGVTVVSLTFCIRDVFVYQRLIRGIVGFLLCVINVGWLCLGRERLSALTLLIHYTVIMITDQIDDTIAVVYFKFVNDLVSVSAFRPHPGVVNKERFPCPRLVDPREPNRNAAALVPHHYCDFIFLMNLGETNYVLPVAAIIFPLITVLIVVHYILTKLQGREENGDAAASQFEYRVGTNAVAQNTGTATATVFTAHDFL